jgi:ornithine cyclodeaminase
MKVTQIFDLCQIKDTIERLNPIMAIEEGFVAYSKGLAIVPPVGELIFQDPPGDAHIKYGYIINDDYFLIKIASGFYENVKKGLPPGNGLMLLFSRKTGELVCILLDEGFLTNIRTAAAGAVAAKYMAPKTVRRIGIFGAGTQGKLQLEYLNYIIKCKDVIVWGVNQEELDAYKACMEPRGYVIETTFEADDIASTCNLIVTATPTKAALLNANQIRKGTHITAVGSDTPEKNELEPAILQKADIVVADSISQCLERGEIYQAIKAGVLKKQQIVELGNVISNRDLQRSSDEQITVVDLTGVAVQDIQIAKAVYKQISS